MSEYIVALCYFLFALSGVMIGLWFRKQFPGRKLTPLVFLCYLLICAFYGVIHLIIVKYGFISLFPPVNKWIEGNVIVRTIAAVFIIPQAFIGPSFYKSKR